MSNQSFSAAQQFADLDLNLKSGAQMWFSNLDTNSPWGTAFKLPAGGMKEIGLDSKLLKGKSSAQITNDFVQVSTNQRWNQGGFSDSNKKPAGQSKLPMLANDILDSPLEEETSPNLYKTELCRSFEETGTCRYGMKCQFAHGLAELRHISRHPKYKTEVCKTFHTVGTCPYGKRCRFIHTEGPLITPQSPPVKKNQPIQPEIKPLSKPPGVFVENNITNGSLISNGWSSNWNGAFPSTSTVNFNPVVQGLPPKIPASQFPPLHPSLENLQERSRLGIFQQICS